MNVTKCIAPKYPTPNCKKVISAFVGTEKAYLCQECNENYFFTQKHFECSKCPFTDEFPVVTNPDNNNNKGTDDK